MNIIEYHPAPIANYLKHGYKLAEQRYSTGCIYKEYFHFHHERMNNGVVACAWHVQVIDRLTFIMHIVPSQINMLNIRDNLFY